jgi:hypothetical protein
VLTEGYEPFEGHAPIWGYADALARRHGSAPSPFPPGTTAITDGLEGANVGTLFMDGHADAADEKLICVIFQCQPNEQ